MSDEIELKPVAEHLGGAYPCGDGNTWMPDVWGYLIVRCDVKNVLDIGCGYGYAVKWFNEMGVHCIGIDGDINCIEHAQLPSHVYLHDFTVGKACPDIIKPGDVFDLAWSAEFLEHVEERFIPNYMEAFQHCRYAAVTHAVPGQPGAHHVTCKDDDFWVEHFARYGFAFSPEETEALRKTDRWHAGWGRCTLMFFERLKA